MKMPTEYMLDCVAEEAGEISQIRGKIGRFGLHDTKRGSDEDNAERLRKEFHDILATYMEFCSIERLPFDIDDLLVAEKLRRVYDYKFLSYLNGVVDIRDDLQRVTECVYYNHPELQEMLHCVNNMTPEYLSHYLEIADRSEYKSRFVHEAIGKLMACIT